MDRFAGKTVLVTGAASGIGLATAEQFARGGAAVIATDIDREALLSSVAGLSGGDALRIETQVHDVTDPDAWERVIADCLQRHGALDVLFNNAGGGQFASLEDTTLEQWRRVMQLNVDSVFFGMQAGIRAMRTRGGAIINNSSITAMIGEPKLAAYSASKGAVRAMTKSAAVDCARKGYPIRINSIHPGYTRTKLVTAALAALGDQAAEQTEAVIGSIPMGRLAEPREIAGPVLFLASEDAAYMTGAELIVDGGLVAA